MKFKIFQKKDETSLVPEVQIKNSEAEILHINSNSRSVCRRTHEFRQETYNEGSCEEFPFKY